jgi:tRNA nucleotidyltransferase (CCA-adding enzyme)
MNYTKAPEILKSSHKPPKNLISKVMSLWILWDLLLVISKKDIDIVAVGSGIELVLKVWHYFQKKPVQVFKTYGTATCYV